MKGENGKEKGERRKEKGERRKVLSTPSALRAPSGSSVKLGSLTLMRYKMTFSHFSKDLIRHPVSGGQRKVK